MSTIQTARKDLMLMIRILEYQKLLTPHQVKELNILAQSAHLKTLRRVFKNLSNVTKISTLPKIIKGTGEAKKERKELTDDLRWKYNRKLFGRSNIRESMSSRGNFLTRQINLPVFDLVNKKYLKSISDKVDLYTDLLHVDIKKCGDALYKTNVVKSAVIQYLLMFVTYDAGKEQHYITGVMYRKGFSTFNPNNFNEEVALLRESARTFASDVNIYIVGYKILYRLKDNASEHSKLLTETNLLAFKSSNDKAYHKLTTKSTHNNSICIYESFTIINNIKPTTHMYTLDQRLTREGDDIEKAVRSGLLIKSLSLLNIKYDKEAYIVFYKNESIIIHISNIGIMTVLKDKKLLDDMPIYLYDKAKQHIAPSVYRNVLTEEQVKQIKDETTNNAYKLMPAKKLKDRDANELKNEIINNTIAFDFETFTDDKNNAIPYCCCVYGMLDYKDISMSFYGLDCAKQFIDFLQPYTQLLNHNKHKTAKINDILIYGFNNSNFDNMFIFTELFRKDNNTKYLMSDNSIKKIEHNNLTFYDLRLIYGSGSLRTICHDLGFKEQKSVFPYSFVNADNIKYVGDKPAFDCYEFQDITIEDYDKLPNIFNVKDETIKYCLLDTRLTYNLAVEHIRNSVGTINGITYNTVKCITVGSISKKLYNTCFQKDTLFASPDDLLINERRAYYGGRTSIFRKQHNEGDLYYYDINSSYPKAMTKMMPYRVIRHATMNQTFNLDNVDTIEDTTLYYISSYNYVGNDSHVINNLIERDEKNNTQSYKNYEKNTVHWGIEVRSAVLNNFVVKSYKFAEYEERPVFKSFAEYMYNERLKIKSSNPSRSKYFKSILNNLYGKFAQGQSNKTQLLNNFDDIFDYIGDDLELLINYTPIADGQIGFVEYKDVNTKDNYASLSRFSSYITACGRVALHQAMVNVGFENVYYCDTDSIFTTKKLDDSFISETELGKFKLECVISQADFIAPKMYKIVRKEDVKSIIKSKGIKSHHIDDKDITELLETNTITKRHTVFRKSLNGIKIVKQDYSITSTFKTIL